MLDHLEQLESYFADALAKEAEATTGATGGERQVSGRYGGGASPPGSAGGGEDEDKDEFDREEEQQAREDLAAIEQVRAARPWEAGKDRARTGRRAFPDVHGPNVLTPILPLAAAPRSAGHPARQVGAAQLGLPADGRAGGHRRR
jgi:hypothetical protein